MESPHNSQKQKVCVWGGGSHVICFYYILHYIASCLFCVQHSQQTVPALWGTRAQQRWASSSRLPMNTVVLFVPQQEAWVVEKDGPFPPNPGTSELPLWISSMYFNHYQTLK